MQWTVGRCRALPGRYRAPSQSSMQWEVRWQILALWWGLPPSLLLTKWDNQKKSSFLPLNINCKHLRPRTVWFHVVFLALPQDLAHSRQLIIRGQETELCKMLS